MPGLAQLARFGHGGCVIATIVAVIGVRWRAVAISCMCGQCLPAITMPALACNGRTMHMNESSMTRKRRMP